MGSCADVDDFIRKGGKDWSEILKSADLGMDYAIVMIWYCQIGASIPV